MGTKQHSWYAVGVVLEQTVHTQTMLTLEDVISGKTVVFMHGKLDTSQERTLDIRDTSKAMLR